MEEGQKVGHVGFFWLVIGGEGRGQKSNLISRRCSRAATIKGKNGNDIIQEPEVIPMTISDVIAEPEVKITMTTVSEMEKINFLINPYLVCKRERVPGPEWSVVSHEKSSKSK